MSLERARPLPLVHDMSHAGNLGLDEARLERVRAYVDDQVHNLNRAPFMQVRILRTGGIRGTGKEEASTAVAFTHSAGHIAPAPAPLADPDTLIRIYSMTKPIVSVAAMILVERALLHLDHPVERYLPCFQDMEVFISPGVTRPATTKMTVQHLLTHSSGLTYNFFPGPVAEMYKEHGIEFLQSDIGTVDLPADAEKPGALLDMVEKLAALPLKCDPGTEFNYSFSTDVMGCLIEQVTGKRLPEFLREEIFVPLGMADTGFHVPPEKIARFAACYNLKASGSGFELTDAPAESSFLTPHLHLTSGGGGLISSLNDYSTFVSMLLGKGQANGARILSRKTVEYMMINQYVLWDSCTNPISLNQCPKLTSPVHVSNPSTLHNCAHLPFVHSLYTRADVPPIRTKCTPITRTCSTVSSQVSSYPPVFCMRTKVSVSESEAV